MSLQGHPIVAIPSETGHKVAVDTCSLVTGLNPYTD